MSEESTEIAGTKGDNPIDLAAGIVAVFAELQARELGPHPRLSGPRQQT